ncbi:MAG: dihydrodipicolinate synthase family protein [Verrucomicrobia bacterium]|nr:dihydrodipicolinate synthase family protein [Verrucomicrobiota bacterium]
MLKGIVPPLVTPLSDRDTLDVSGLERLIEHLIAGGVSGLFILGTTGEGPSLGYRLRRELIERAITLAAGRVPVLAGITDTAFTESLNLARHAAEHGADSVVLAAPYYFPAGQAELIEYMGDLIKELPLPMYLYNMPGLTKVNFESSVIRAAMQWEKVIGIKDSSCDMIYFHKLLRLTKQRPDWSLLVGPEELTAEAVLLGAHGGVNGGANIHPRLYVDLYEAAVAQDLAKVRELHTRVIELASRIYAVGRHKSAIIKGIKCSLNLLGICSDVMAEPFHRFEAPEREQIRDHLHALHLL